MSSDPAGHPLSATATATEHVEEVAADTELVGGVALRALEVGAIVLIGLLVCPPLFILVVAIVVPLVVLMVLVGLVSVVLAAPYLIVSHLRGHHAGHAVVRQRLTRAFHALIDLAPHRLLAGIRRGHAAP
jgi:hypothetical protein